MLIDTTLLAENRVLVEGLVSGTLRRFGGVVRDARSGRIVRHLLESPALSEESTRASVSKALETLARSGTESTRALKNVTGTISSMQGTLSSVLQLSQIAAGASVLNLGVSVVGFAYMGYKLHKI